MGVYTEIIFGAEISTTNQQVLDVLTYLLGDSDEIPAVLVSNLPDHPFFKCDRWKWIANTSSYYFGVNVSHRLFKKEPYKENCYIVSFRANIKNYSNEIEHFLNWISPYIVQGSGSRDFYAIVCYEEQDEPTIYYLKDRE